jgi:hypothetical protein
MGSLSETAAETTLHWYNGDFYPEFLMVLSVIRLVSDVRMADKLWIGKDLEGTRNDVIEVLPQHLHGRTGEIFRIAFVMTKNQTESSQIQV